MIYHGDCLDVMAGMDPESMDAVVTDPPYGLEFMGKQWDKLDSRARFRTRVDGRTNPKYGKSVVTVPEAYIGGSRAQEWHQRWAEAAFRVAKPSAYLLAFGGTRTVHRMTVALEDAGWIIRDMLVWAYASGFPKSKASLKPAWEPIVMARKPGPLRMLAIDECRIGWGADTPPQEEWNAKGSTGAVGANGYAGQFSQGMKQAYAEGKIPVPSGRWPANVILTDPIFDGGWDGVVGGGESAVKGEYRDTTSTVERPSPFFGTVSGATHDYRNDNAYANDSGTYSRFFLIPKADRADREPVLGGLPAVDPEARYGSVQDARPHTPDGYVYDRHARQNVHPTVKPVDLMRHLVRLVTPTGGTVLDCFAGSGSTLIAAEMEGFDWIGIEKEAEYVQIAEARLNGTQRGLGLPA